jgi:plastocyanin
MIRKVIAAALVLGAAAALTTTAFARHATTPTLVGTDGPGFTITLKRNSKVVKTLKAGTYRLVIHDRASIHSWSLDGPNGFEKDFTKVPFVGTKTFTVKLKAGSYKFYCPPHESMMFGRFKVT